MILKREDKSKIVNYALKNSHFLKKNINIKDVLEAFVLNVVTKNEKYYKLFFLINFKKMY